jgi:hypothetical protein
MNGYQAMIYHNAIVGAVIVLGMFLTHSAWPLWGMLFFANYKEGK